VSILTRIRDGRGTSFEWGITDQHAGLVQDIGNSSLPAGAIPPETVYTQFFTDTGFIDGDENMNVDGSTITQIFKISPDPDRDIIITQIVLFLSDSQIQLKRFGFIPELTVGFEVDLVQAGEIVDVIPFAVTNMDLIQFAGGNSNQFDNINAANNDAILVTFDFAVEIRLVAGSLDEIQARINDDLTGLEEFTALMRGKKLREAA